jgi:non-specific serine/threonine protein kinase
MGSIPAGFRCGELQIDAANRRVLRGSVEIPLEPRVLGVLLQLIARPGELLTREQLLDAVWGHRYVTPSTLSRVIALARRAFGDDAEVPRFIQTVHGAGYKYIGPISTQTLPGAHEPGRFAPVPAVRLPSRMSPLLGREADLAQIARMLEQSRALTVVGAGGMGKTQCALEFARSASAGYPDGVWFFDLVALQGASQWLRFLATALSIPAGDDQEALERVCQAMAGRQVLLLIDNCDQISAEIGVLVFAILRASQAVRVLATSRQPLGFLGEAVLRLPPLALPRVRRPIREADLAEVASAAAVRLLVARIALVQPGFELTTANAPDISSICERLDGMPLAIELAAARFALLSAEQVLERLENRFRFLASEASGRDERHRNLEALLEWSYQLLSPIEQRLLAWLGQFVGGWTIELAIDFAAALGHDAEEVIDLLGELANKSLVTVDSALSPPRYRLLESLREFALARLEAMGEEADARRAHVDAVRRMARAAGRDMFAGRVRERCASLPHEHGNIERALESAERLRCEPEVALEIAGDLLFYFKCHGAYIWALSICDRAICMAGSRETAAHPRALLARGVMCMHTREPGSVEALVHAARLAALTGDSWCEGYSRAYLAMALIDAGRHAEGAREIRAARRIASHVGEGNLEGLIAIARSWSSLARDCPGKAIAVLRGACELGSDPHQHHFILTYLALAHYELGFLREAAKLSRASLEIAITLGNVRGAAGGIEACGYLLAGSGRHAESARLLGAAERIRVLTGIPLFHLWLPSHDRVHASLQTALGEVGYRRALHSADECSEGTMAQESLDHLREFAQAS